MLTIPAVKESGITVVTGLSDSAPILELTARLALLYPVQVIVGGNRFDAHQLSRIIRRHTVHLDPTLERIHQARPFTCLQVLNLLAETPPAKPLIALDLLTTFYDENISDSESIRLVRIAASHLQRLGRQAPILVTLRPPATAARPGLMKRIQAIADQFYIYEPPEKTIQPPLF